MKPTLPGIRSAAFPVLGILAAAVALAATPFHFELTRSEPADQATVHELPRVKLWFSEPPEDGTVSIHLVDADGEVVPTTEAKQDPADPASYSVLPSDKPAAATYTVHWRGMGDDGHVVRGELTFTVSDPRGPAGSP